MHGSNLSINSGQTYNSSLLCVTPRNDSPYAKLGQVEAVDLISFAHQIASGMVAIYV